MATAMVMAMAMAMAMAMVMAMTIAIAITVIRPEYAEGARNHENHFFVKKTKSMKTCNFDAILVISGPSRRQKWIRLEILR